MFNPVLSLIGAGIAFTFLALNSKENIPTLHKAEEPAIKKKIRGKKKEKNNDPIG